MLMALQSPRKCLVQDTFPAAGPQPLAAQERITIGSQSLMIDLR